MRGFVIALLCLSSFDVLHSQIDSSAPTFSGDEISVKIVPPLMRPPDSLGGNDLRGEAYVRILLHWSGSILLSQVTSLEVSRDSSEPIQVYAFSGHPTVFVDTTCKDKSVRDYLSYVQEIVALTRYQVDYGNPYFKRFGAFWITYLVQLNPFK
jgi:hypothetical protein